MFSRAGVTRRQVIIGAGATIASASLCGVQAHALMSVAGSADTAASAKLKPSLKKSFRVIHPSSKAFNAYLDKHYPGLTSLAGFEAVRPLTLIVKSKIKTPTSALSVSWSLTSSSGQRTVHRYFSFYKPSKVLKTPLSGEYPVLGANKACIISPYFSWTPARYKKASSPSVLVALLQSDPVKKQLAYDAAAATSVKGRFEAAITTSGGIIGQRSKALANHYVITRNAEHDEALLLAKDHASASPKPLKALLLEHKHAKRDPQASDKEKIYFRARVRYATLLHHALRHTDENVVRKVLESVRTSPQTVLSRKPV